MKPDFEKLAERFDNDDVFLNYLWEDGFVNGFFVGCVLVVVIFVCLSITN